MGGESRRRGVRPTGADPSRTDPNRPCSALLLIATLVVAALTVGISLPLGVVGHKGSTMIVVLNGLRLLRSLK
ncbi:MAG: hypothetical protein H0U10_05710 [Chloroflexia bacterium]|nr:hypothetical protein [Chloroflexia bacterium]